MKADERNLQMLHYMATRKRKYIKLSDTKKIINLNFLNVERLILFSLLEKKAKMNSHFINRKILNLPRKNLHPNHFKNARE